MGMEVVFCRPSAVPIASERSPFTDPHTQIAPGLKQLVTLTRVTFLLRTYQTVVKWLPL